MKEWSFASVWNEALDTDKQRELKQRDYTYASELGRSYYERYWKMKGRKPTTPPSIRAQRKFEAGNLTEWVLQQVLVRAGVLQNAQLVVKDDSGAMPVSGRCDFVAGGKVQDIDIEALGLPETFALIAETAINKLREKYPEGLCEQGLEIKSCSAMMYERYMRAPGTHHALQAYFYARTTGKPYMLVYISRDDLRIKEWVISPNSRKWEKLYLEDLRNMAAAFALPEEEAKTRLKEPLLTWDGEKFGKNWEVEYSNYLTDYGFKRSDLYADGAKVATRLNNVIKRIKEGKNLTKINEEAMALGIKFYPGCEEILNKLRSEYAKA